MRRVLTPIVVLGLGLATLWLLDPSSSTPPPLPKGVKSETTGQTATVASGAFVGSVGAGDQNDVPILRDEGTPIDTTKPGPHVLVVRGDDKQPVVNAQVFFIAENDPRASNGRSRQISRLSSRTQTASSSRWHAPEQHGKRLRTDEFGKVQLPGGTGRYLCSAKKDREFGFLALPARPGNHTITLQADEELLIVVKHAGVPARAAASVPVGVLQQYKSNRTSRIWRGTTDERGHAIVRHVQLLRRDVAKDQPEGFSERFAAIAMVPSTPATMIDFDGRPLKQESVQLTLPPFGSLLATLVDHNGTALLSPARIAFGAPLQPIKPGDMRISASNLMTTVAKPLGTAPIEVPYAQVGVQVIVTARYPYDRRAASSEPTMGPAKTGQRVAIEIAPLARHTVFAGRFLHPNGTGLAAQTVAITIWRDDKVQSTASAMTIANGQWDLVLSGRTEVARWRMEFRCQHAPSEDNSTDSWLGAIVELPPWPPGKRIELGNIVLGELPPLAAGIVVDDEGNPVANASVNIQQELPQAAQNASTNNIRSLGTSDLEVVFEGGSSTGSFDYGKFRTSRNQPWRSLRHLATRTAVDGTFRIHAAAPAGPLRVRADTGDHAAQTVPLVGSNTNLRITIARNGVLMGRVLLPEWLPDGAVSVTVREHEKTDGRSSNTSTRVRKSSDGKFVLQPLRPGRYDVLVMMRNLKAPMASIFDVVVKPGINKEPRLQSMDVRQSLFRYYLRAFDDAGQAFPLDGPIHARFQQPDGSFVESGFRWQAGKAELISVHPSAELTFFGRGFESRQQQYGPGEHDVFLKTQRPAMVQVAGARGLSGPTRKVRISAILVGDTGLPSSLSGVDQITGRNFGFARWDLGRSSGGWLGATDVVEIPLMTAGKYQLLFRAHATESSKTPQTSITLGTFALRPDGTTITNVPLDTAKITEALRTIDKQWQSQLARNKKRSKR
ncbi:MAG: hypothetical protein ACJAYX_002292 [Planctomycetota bacterium]|jgi:hypothetical protein